MKQIIWDFFAIIIIHSTTNPSQRRMVRSVVAANASSCVTMMKVCPSS